ncbi:sugar lactone lactonase YvrE [Dysgonomonas alginatilytica]|uniref:Sugar lactone lactonase YvrE n=2 Tax=Dysgonomonas alginatilytica TaxID=1605892 RepID=A0A2V3PI34_9BACT|nr:sugar lactone lactonase YvrE [Dysgonomonas alginatilytica]
MKQIVIILFCLFITTVSQVSGQISQDDTGYASVYTTKLDDPLAIYFTPDNFNIKTDGSTDVSDALQEAINKVQETVRFGIVFIPEGTYRISKTIHLWKGIRLIGYGNKRPQILLGKNTPGFQEGNEKYLFHFTSDRPRRSGQPVSDANAGTFYSGIQNINIKIAEGNPSAIAIRFHAAQHCFLSHMDFNLSSGNIGVEDICNEIEYCRFYGGDYGIKTKKTAPGWQALIIDSYFEKQKKAAISTEEAEMIIIRNHFKDIPVVVDIPQKRSEQLWISDSRFENISQSGIIVSKEKHPKTQVNIENVVCINVPVFLTFRTSQETIKSQGKLYHVKNLTHGLHYAVNDNSIVKTSQDIVSLTKLPPLVPSDILLLPSTESWTNLKSLGAVGDGVTDDTEVLKKAIANHKTIYLPSGHYRVTEPIVLKPETNLIGLHPSITQIILRDSTEMYQGIGTPLPLLETPVNGVNIVNGIGLNTSGVNARAVAAKWMAGTKSMMNDVRFLGGHGTYSLKGRDVPVYNDNRTADGIPYRKWDTQNWSLWITNGGGGTFKDIWTPSPYASAGLYISDTQTEGRIYCMSIEHHVRNEAIIDNVSNWKIYGLQLEEESGEGPYCLPLKISNSNNLLFANTFSYRVSRVTTPYPYAILTENSENLTFRGLRTYTWTKYLFDNTLHNATNGKNVRPREIALLKISNAPIEKLEPQFQVKKITEGFDFIDGATVDKEGNPYFIDYRWQRIYRWNIKKNGLEIICELPIFPVSLAFDTKGNLLVVTRFVQIESIFNRGDIKVISMDPNNPTETITELQEVPFSSVDQSKIKSIIYQSSRYRIEHDSETAIIAPIKTCYITADGSTIIPNTSDIAQTYSLKESKPNETVYIASNAAQKTFAAKIGEKGTLLEPRLFAREGEQDVLTDKKGNVYISAGNILIYNKEGDFIKSVEVPERPSSIVIGGANADMLYICARKGFYSVKIE